MIVEIATLAINFGLCCFGADVLLASSNKSRLPITNLYMDISYKVISNSMSFLTTFPGGKAMIGGIFILIAKDIGFIDYAARKIEVYCSKVLDFYDFNFECYDHRSFVSQFDTSVNCEGEVLPMINND